MQTTYFQALRLIALMACIPMGFAALAETNGEANTSKTQGAALTSLGQSIPAGARGILVIDRPREVTLLQLRGMGGRGDVVLRSDEPGTCLAFPIRFVAGDFGGEKVSGHLASPIRLVLQSRRVTAALENGYDVVSDSYRVSQQAKPGVDIVIQAGLDDSFGFVINPGRNILADVFGVATRRLSCPPA